MTKAELIRQLEEWNDETELEVSIPMDWNNPFEGRLWAAIDCVEPRGTDKIGAHCLINVSEVTMA